MSRRHQPDSQRPRPSASHRLAARALTFFLLLTLLAAALPATAGASTISRRIAAILRDNGVATSRTGVSVYDRTAGASLYSWNSARLLAPASNMKLVTSSAALVTWPADHRFPTSLFFTLPLKPGQRTIYGDVYLKGYGDPAFSTLAYQREAYGLKTGSIQEFVVYLKSLGVKKIQGRVLGDATWFDARRVVSKIGRASWRERV